MPQDPLVIFLYGLIGYRILIIAGGILCMWFGFRLFRYVSASDANAVLTMPGGWKFTATQIGPGIFFALFGSIVLGYSLAAKMEFSEQPLRQEIAQHLQQLTQSTTNRSNDTFKKSQIRVAGSFSPVSAIPSELAAVNTLIELHARQNKGNAGLTPDEYELFLKVTPYLSGIQRAYINNQFGAGTFEETSLMIKECKTNTNLCQSYREDPAKRDKFDRILEALTATIEK